MMPPATEATEARAQPVPLEVTKYHLKHVYQKKKSSTKGGGGVAPPWPTSKSAGAEP